MQQERKKLSFLESQIVSHVEAANQPCWRLRCIPDIDECTQGSHNCSLAETCYNIQGGHRCLSLDCPPNYRKVSDTYVWNSPLPLWLAVAVKKVEASRLPACWVPLGVSRVFVAWSATNWRLVQAALAPRRLGPIPAVCSLECYNTKRWKGGFSDWNCYSS